MPNRNAEDTPSPRPPRLHLTPEGIPAPQDGHGPAVTQLCGEPLAHPPPQTPDRGRPRSLNVTAGSKMAPAAPSPLPRSPRGGYTALTRPACRGRERARAAATRAESMVAAGGGSWEKAGNRPDTAAGPALSPQNGGGALRPFWRQGHAYGARQGATQPGSASLAATVASGVAEAAPFPRL